MIRATHGIREGSWYFEIFIEQHDGHTRLGWSREQADLRVPVGFDNYSYSYRDVQGDVFHKSRGKPYGEPYGPGDVIGCFIHLPPSSPPKIEGITLFIVE